jgi:hypothetical protein
MQRILFVLTLGVALSLAAPALARHNGRTTNNYPGYYNGYDSAYRAGNWYSSNGGYAFRYSRHDARRGFFVRPFRSFLNGWRRHHRHDASDRFDRDRDRKRHIRKGRRDRFFRRQLPRWDQRRHQRHFRGCGHLY